MKRRTSLLFLVFAIFCGSNQLYAQGELWGLSNAGGSYGFGAISKSNAEGTGFLVQKEFMSEVPGTRPGYTTLVKALDGKLYGMTSGGGPTGQGVIFSYDPSNGTYQMRYNFYRYVQFEGAQPQGSLSLANNGKLYGMTTLGGNNNYGVIFEFDPVTDAYIPKIHFSGASNGGNPLGDLFLAANGKLYGMTRIGGANNLGVLFEFDPSNGGYTKLVDFDGAAKGANPVNGLTQALNGKLYGVAGQGGVNNKGVLFSYDLTGSGFLKIRDFDDANGTTPTSLTVLPGGKIYGTTAGGGTYAKGVLFEFDPTNNSYTKRYEFQNAQNGTSPQGGLRLAPNGKLYGTTYNGGANGYSDYPYAGYGVVYEFDVNTLQYQKKMDFNNTNGTYPRGSLTLANNNKFYGLAQTVVPNNTGNGVLFEFDPATGSNQKILDFYVATGGINPTGNLVQGTNGKLYGTTSGGGSYNQGVLFEYDRVTGTYTKRIDFDGAAKGANPYGGLHSGANGKLYGMTTNGGTIGQNGGGVLFEYDVNTNTYTKLTDFGAQGMPQAPYGRPVLATNGKIYGLTNWGGVNFSGTLFEYDISTHVLSKKVEFVGPNGQYPYGSIMQASNGKLYGMASRGGTNNYGVFFEFNPTTSTYTKILDFDGNNGQYPSEVQIMELADGNLYGTVNSGGYSPATQVSGVLFKYNPVSGVYTVLHSFDTQGGHGYGPQGTLTESNGKLFGTTYGGGQNGAGVVFEFDPVTGIFVERQQLPAYNRVNGLLLVRSNQSITFDPLPVKTYSDNSFNANASATSGLTVTLTSSNLNVATITGGTINIVGVGSATITASQPGDQNNLPATSVSQVLVVNKAPLTATADPKTKIYGDPNPGFTITYTGFKGSENATVIDTEPSGSSTAITTSNTGTYPITLTGGADNNYAITLVNSTLTVTKSEITATADAKSKTYGDVNPALTMSFTGFKGTDHAGVLDILPSPSTAAITSTNVGSYPINLTGGTDNNYTINLVSGALTINKASLTATADAKSKIYGDANPAFTITYEGFKGTDGPADLDTPPLPSTTAVTSSSVGSYPITLTTSTDNNYTIALLSGTLTVLKATLTASADSKTKVYGNTNPTFTISYSGFKVTDNAGVIDTQPVPSSLAVTTSNVGSYVISLTGGSDDNYSFSLVDGTLGVTKAPLTATADAKTKIYGSANPAFTITYSGFKGTDNATVIDTPPSPSSSATTNSPVGSYTIGLTGGSDNNYALTLVNGTLTVTKATLTATADNKTKIYGDSNPVFTITYSGFKGTDNASVIDSPPTSSTTATTTSSVGGYTITLTGGVDNNYTISRVNGTLTVTKAMLVATADPKSKLYGTSNPAFTITYTGFKGTDNASVIDTPPSPSTSATTLSNTGSYAITLAGGLDNNYSFTLVNGTLTINKATLTVTAESKTKVYGNGNPDLTMTYSGFVAPDDLTVIDQAPSISTTAGEYSNVGTYPITLLGGSDNNYTFTFVNSTLTIYKEEQTIIFGALGNKIIGEGSFILFAIGGPTGNPVTFTSSNPAVVTVFGNVATIVGTGNSIITASQAGNTNYNAATSVMQTLTVNQATQTITFNAIDAKTFGDASFDPGATASSGLVIGYTSSNLAVATVSNNIVTIVGVGTTDITATQVGNANYTAAADVMQTLTVNAATLSVTPASPVVCMGTGTTLDASGALSYSWSPSTGLSSTSGASVVASPLETTTYTVTATYANGTTATATATVKVTAMPIAAGGNHSIIKYCGECGGSVTSNGLNSSGQLGDGTTTQKNVPTALSLSQVTAVAAGASHSLFLMADGTVWGTGLNTNGQLGNGTITNKTSPVQVTGLTGIVAIAAGNTHSLFLKNDGTVWACGINSNNQLGDGTATQRNVPVQVVGLTGITKISAGGLHSVFLKSDGTVWACGRNANGQLGDGTLVAKATAIQIPGLSGIIDISAGGNHSVFLKSNNTVWVTGLNSSGQLGNGTTAQRTTPGALATINYVTATSAGATHTLFVRNDGTAWATGLNSNGQLGDGTVTASTVPVFVSNLAGVSAVSAGATHSLFLTDDGMVWATGRNVNGQLGDNTTTTRLLPVEVANANPCGRIARKIQPQVIIAEELNVLETYPNPVNNTLTIDLPDGAAARVSPLSISNGMGKILINDQFNTGEATKTINTSELPAGMYLLHVDAQNGPVSKKVLVIH
jgi:uncharacterized repeat protein (TIGR03803 family)